MHEVTIKLHLLDHCRLSFFVFSFLEVLSELSQRPNWFGDFLSEQADDCDD